MRCPVLYNLLPCVLHPSPPDPSLSDHLPFYDLFVVCLGVYSFALGLVYLLRLPVTIILILPVLLFI